jgi:site-specific DNA-cytosine methylase
LIDDLTKQANELDYAVTVILVNALYCGTAQVRKRMFFVAHDIDITWRPMDYTERPIMWALNQVADDIGPLPPMSKYYQQFVPFIKQGEGIREAWERYHKENNIPLTKNKHGKISGRPSFASCQRQFPDKPSGCMCGHYMVHPTENRLLSFNEMGAIAGYPKGYKLDPGKFDDHGALYARGVSPKVAEWLAGSISDSLKNPIKVSSGFKIKSFLKKEG